ncbi:MAG: hypothetical protein Q7U47_15665 [Paludibacter sp.]|nr:hypothetical protein [Paludibacter sp.]
MKNTILLFILLSISLRMFSQYDPKPNLIPPSADALSLGKFGDIQTNLFTGRVNINIPLHTIKEHDITVPVSMSYLGGGIKVTEQDGLLGLGWTLNVGGVISRSVAGMPDELMDFNNRVVGFDRLGETIFSHIPNADGRREEFVNAIKARTSGYYPLDRYYFGETGFNDKECYLGYLSSVYGEQYDNGHFDTAQDTYSFNFLDKSGVFVFDKNNYNKYNKCIIQSNDGVSISYDKFQNSFTVTDANGYIYIFKDVESEIYYYKVNYGWYMTGWESLPEQEFKYTNSWWLSSITSPTGEEVTFNYTKKSETKCWNESDITYGLTFYKKEMVVNDALVLQPFYKEHNSYGRAFREVDLLKLSSIETRNSLVKFQYSANLCKPVLKQINVLYNKLNESIINRRIDFCQSNFTTMVNTSRLRLDSIREIGMNSTIAKSHKFTYIETAKGGNNVEYNIIPNLNTLQRDHWGYWTDSGGKFPDDYYFAIYSSNEGYNRNSDPLGEGAVAGVLASITYPTGGKSELIWEPNTFSMLGRAAERQSTASESFFKNLDEYDDVTWYTEKLYKGEFVNINDKTVYIPNAQNINIDLTNMYSYLKFSYNTNDPIWERCISGWTCPDTTLYSLKLPYLLVITPSGKKDYIRIDKRNTSYVVLYNATQSGNYRFKLMNEYGAFMCQDAECQEFYYRYPMGGGGDVTIKYYQRNSATKPGYIVGGCRIQRIINSTGTDKITKLYNYYLDGIDPASPSSGVLTYIPYYGKLNYKNYWVNAKIITYEQHSPMITLSSNGIPYTLNSGSHIEYSTITEMTVRGNLYDQPLNPERGDRNIKKYEYWTSKDADCEDIDDTKYDSYVSSDMLKLTSRNFKRGDLKRLIEYTDRYNVKDFKYEIIEKENNDTITGSLFTVADMSELGGYVNNCNTYGTVYPYKDFGIVKYRVIPYNKRIIEQKDSGNISKDYVKYSYSNASYSVNKLANSPLSKTSIDSKGDTITEYYTYTNINNIHTCVTVNKGKIINAYRNEFNSLGQIIQKYIALINVNQLPNAIEYNLGKQQIISGTHPIIGLTNNLIESYMYDRNRLVQVTNQTSGLSVVYLWSYNGTHPIAELKNCTFDVVKNTIGGDNVIGLLFSSYSPNMIIVNNLRSTLSSSQVSTLTFELLVGIKTLTDPRGVKITFEYDEFGQLKSMKDSRDKLLKTINYHFIGKYL